MSKSPRVLMILTSNNVMGQHGKPTGIWAEELAVPYYALADAGATIDFASPRGGAAPFDPQSLKPAGQNEAPAVERLVKDETLQRRLAQMPTAASVDASAYDAVFFPGGHGTMWDLPGDAGVQRAVEAAWAAGRFVAAVCHGPAGLVSARRPDGQSILAGKRVNGFTDEEEAAVGLADIVPFHLEQRMRELGGRFERGAMWSAYAVRDGQLITGQNPMSSAAVATELLSALGLRAAQAS